MKKHHLSLSVMAVGICLIYLFLLGKVEAQEEPAEGEKVEGQEPVKKEKTSQKDKSLRDDANPVEDFNEDQFIVKQVQRGIKSDFYKRGRYSVKYEKGIHYFHRLLSQYLS